MPDVNTVILGPVIGSQVLTAGHDIVLGNSPCRAPGVRQSGRVLLSAFDWELLDLSGFPPDRGLAKPVFDAAWRELRLLLMAIPPEGCAVLPPTYYHESPLCRETLLAHELAIERGYIRLVTEYVDLGEYLARKRERYKKAAHFRHYADAYYHPAFRSLSDLPFQKTPKTESIGSRALDLWGASLDGGGKIAMPPKVIGELRRRAFDTERPAFLWENVAEHLEDLGVSVNAPGATQIRTVKNRCYLTAYALSGISVPHGSSLVTDLAVPDVAAGDYNVHAWRRAFEVLGLLDDLCGMALDRLLALKLRPEVAGAVATIRGHLARGRPTDRILGTMQKAGSLGPFVAAFRKS